MTVFNSIMFISAWRLSSQSEEPVLPLVAFNATISQAAIVPIFNTQCFCQETLPCFKKIVIHNHNPIKCLYSYKQPLSQFSTQRGYINFCYIEKDVIIHNHIQYSFPHQISEAAIVPIFNTIW